MYRQFHLQLLEQEDWQTQVQAAIPHVDHVGFQWIPETMHCLNASKNYYSIQTTAVYNQH